MQQSDSLTKGIEDVTDIAVMLKRKQKRCDEVFAEYLTDASGVAGKQKYEKVLKHILLYRECLNQCGEKLLEEKKKLPNILVLHPTVEPQNEYATEYCIGNNAEQAPDISNDFMQSYLPKVCPSFDKEEAKVLTRSLCHWLFLNGYTCSMLASPK